MIVRKGGFIQLINHAVERTSVESLRVNLKLHPETIILSHSYMFIANDIWYIFITSHATTNRHEDLRHLIRET